MKNFRKIFESIKELLCSIVKFLRSQVSPMFERGFCSIQEMRWFYVLWFLLLILYIILWLTGCFLRSPSEDLHTRLDSIIYGIINFEKIWGCLNYLRNEYNINLFMYILPERCLDKLAEYESLVFWNITKKPHELAILLDLWREHKPEQYLLSLEDLITQQQHSKALEYGYKNGLVCGKWALWNFLYPYSLIISTCCTFLLVFLILLFLIRKIKYPFR